MNGLFNQQQPYQGLLDAGQSLLNARKPGGGFGLLSLLGMALQHQQQQAAYDADPWAGLRGPSETLTGADPVGVLQPASGARSGSKSDGGGYLPATFSGRSVGSDGKVRSFDTSSNRWYTVA